MLLFAAVDGLGWVGHGLDVVGNGWDVMVEDLVLLGGDIFISVSGFAIDRSKKLYKTQNRAGNFLQNGIVITKKY